MKFNVDYGKLCETKWNPKTNRNETRLAVCTTSKEAVKKYLDIKSEDSKVQEECEAKGFLITAYSLNSFLKCLESMGCYGILIQPYGYDEEFGHLYLILVTITSKLKSIEYII